MSAKSNRRGRQKRMGKRQSARARGRSKEALQIHKSLHLSMIMGCVCQFLHLSQLSVIKRYVCKFLVPHSSAEFATMASRRREEMENDLAAVCVCVFMFLLVCVDSYCVLIRLDFLIWGPKACRLQLRICVDR